MKRTILIIILLNVNLIQAQKNTYRDISNLIEKSKIDSIANIERLAAVKFHGLINNYRLSKGRKILIWDDTLWIASRNHNLCMMEQQALSHSESSRNTYFTGQEPNERYDFASGGRSTFQWTGENALYNNSCLGTTRHEIAGNMARSSFEQWRKSAGHNRNMLARNYRHGVAFLIKEELVWATDLFTKAERPREPTNRMFTSNGLNLFSATIVLRDELPEKLNTSLGFKPKKVGKRKNTSLKTAKNLLYRLTRNEDLTDDVMLSRKTRGYTKGIFGFFSKEYTSYELVLEKEIPEFHMDTIITEMLGHLMENQTISPKSKIDLSVAMKRKKQRVRISMVCVVYSSKKNAIHSF
jgi:uncharacterized protein YkwD